MSEPIPYSGDLLAGVDEVGRGALAGEVMAAAVILDPGCPIDGLADSKALSPARREQMYTTIVTRARCYSVGRATRAEIDKHNILQATLLAMSRAVQGLKIRPEFVVVDGNRLPDWTVPSCAVIKGDTKIPAISAASIIAKVTRDRELVAFDEVYPGYDFAAHKGYGTAVHLAALKRLGPCPLHRRSFRPVAELSTQ